ECRGKEIGSAGHRPRADSWYSLFQMRCDLTLDHAPWSTMPPMNASALARLALLPLLGIAFTAVAAGPLVVVHKNEYCGCCNGWVEHMRKAGFEVEVRNVANMSPVKARVGAPARQASRH